MTAHDVTTRWLVGKVCDKMPLTIVENQMDFFPLLIFNESEFSFGYVIALMQRQ